MKYRLHLPDEIPLYIGRVVYISINSDHPVQFRIEEGITDEGAAHEIIMNHPQSPGFYCKAGYKIIPSLEYRGNEIL